MEPNSKKIRKKRDRLVQIASRVNLNHLFELAVRFYRSEWPQDRTFVVTLYPIPGKEGQSSAQSLDSVESVGVLTDETDDIGRFGVLFHEICHSLYRGQSPEFQTRLEEWFTKGESLYAPLAYHRINEALATALGNGWVVEKTKGKLGSESWYNDRLIEGFARSIYPLVKQYVENGKAIDEPLVKEAIAVFSKTFPKAPYEYEALFGRIVMLIDGDSVSRSEVRDQVNRYFRVSSRSVYNGVDDQQGLQEIASSTDTAVVVTSTKNRGKLMTLATVVPSVSRHLDELKSRKGSYVFWVERSPGRPLLILSGDHTADIISLLQKMKEFGYVRPEQHFQEFNSVE